MKTENQWFKVLDKSTIIIRNISLEVGDNTEPGATIRIELKAHSHGLIYWCSHWEYIEDLVRLKQVMKSEAGPLHSYDYSLPVQVLCKDGAYE